MAYPSLSTFIRSLEHDNELVRIKGFVDPIYEITEIADRESKKPGGGKALLFENTGTEFPLLINGFGSEKRMAKAFEVENLNAITDRIQNIFQKLMTPRHNLVDKLKLIPTLAEFRRFFPKTINAKGECQRVVNLNPDINRLPVLKCWPADGGKFITLPMVITKDPISGIRNVGMYRMQVFDKQLTGMHWHRHKVGARHYEGYKQQNKKMPVAVALGGDPAHIYAATAPLPDNIDEFMLSGFLRSKPVHMVKAISQDIEVPADADIIIEGYIDPSEELLLEGPFGDHTGFYSLEDYFPAFHITCITHRKDAVYPSTIVGIPPQEDAWLAKATEKIFLEPIKYSLAPEIQDMHMPDEGVAHNLTLIKFKKSYPGQAQKIAQALWGAGQMMFNKVMVLTDSNVSFEQDKALIRELFTRFEPEKDLFLNSGPLDILDHSSNAMAYGGKIGVDLSTRLKEETLLSFSIQKHKVLTDKKGKLPENHFSLIKDLAESGIPIRWMAVKEENTDNILHDYLEFNAGKSPEGNKVTVILNKEIVTSKTSLLVWLTLANIDPVRDCYLIEYENHTTSLLIDATRKTLHKDNFQRKWPNYVASSPETIKKVDDVWADLGLGEFVSSPSNEILKWGKGTHSVVPNM